jgi:hypothetical protein
VDRSAHPKTWCYTRIQADFHFFHCQDKETPRNRTKFGEGFRKLERPTLDYTVGKRGEDTWIPGVVVEDRVSGHQDITSITNANYPQVHVSAGKEILDVRRGLPIIDLLLHVSLEINSGFTFSKFADLTLGQVVRRDVMAEGKVKGSCLVRHRARRCGPS